MNRPDSRRVDASSIVEFFERCLKLINLPTVITQPGHQFGDLDTASCRLRLGRCTILYLTRQAIRVGHRPIDEMMFPPGVGYLMKFGNCFGPPAAPYALSAHLSYNYICTRNSFGRRLQQAVCLLVAAAGNANSSVVTVRFSPGIVDQRSGLQVAVKRRATAPASDEPHRSG